MRTILTFLLLLLMASSAQAQPGSDEFPPIDAGVRAAIVDSITAVIDSVYVLEEPAKAIVAGLRKNLADGDYDDLTDPSEFADRLFEDAQAINHDGHFRIMAMPPLDQDVAEAGQDEDPADVERRRLMVRAMNYGFRKAEILPGGVGYVRFDQFGRGEEAFQAAAAAMNFVSNSSAVIIDLRQNGGGSGSMIRFIAGYLFEENVHLINWDIRVKDMTVQSYSADYVPGQRIIDQPVYILTSDRTFSAAEEFTFDMKNLGRATVVGDTTGGGGHTVVGHNFAFNGFRMGIRVPYGRAYNPENNEGFEGVGVIPHMAVPVDQALEAAHVDALVKLLESETDEVLRASLEWVMLDIDSKLNPMVISMEQMEAYIGEYGPRRIFVEDGSLFYQREGRSKHLLQPIGEDLFQVGDLDFFRLSFGRDDDGKINLVIGNYKNGGRPDQNMKEDGGK